MLCINNKSNNNRNNNNINNSKNSKKTTITCSVAWVKGNSVTV